LLIRFSGAKKEGMNITELHEKWKDRFRKNDPQLKRWDYSFNNFLSQLGIRYQLRIFQEGNYVIEIFQNKTIRYEKVVPYKFIHITALNTKMASDIAKNKTKEWLDENNIAMKLAERHFEWALPEMKITST